MSEREHDDGRCCENGDLGTRHDCLKSNPMTDDYTKARFIRMIEALDGVAGVNLDEPSPGDLERVVKAYDETRKELAEAKALIEQTAEIIDSAVYNFECDQECQCCMNNKGIEGELKEALAAYEKWKGGE